MKFEFDKFIAVVKVDSPLQRDYIIYPEKELEKAAKLMVGMDVIANFNKDDIVGRIVSAAYIGDGKIKFEVVKRNNLEVETTEQL